MFKAILYAI